MNHGLIMAWLFALLMLLPVGASAARSVDASWQADQQGLRTFLAQIGMDEQTQKELSQMTASLMNVLTLHADIQDDGVQISARLKGTNVLAASVQNTEKDEVLLRTSLVPGIAMRIPMDDIQARGSELLTQMVGQLMMDLPPVIEAWFAGLSRTEEHGTVIADAYEGGTSSVLYAFDDAELASLIDRVSAALGLREHIRSVTSQAAAANECHYLLRFVRTNDRLIGVSLTVLDAQDAQLATLSCTGFAEKETWFARVVLGYGRDGHTLFDDYQLDCQLKDDAFSLNFMCSEYTDDDAAGFRNAAAMKENRVCTTVLNAEAVRSEAGSNWRAVEQTLISEDGTIISETTGRTTQDADWLNEETIVYAGAGMDTAMTFRMEGTQSDPIVFGSEDETLIDTDGIGSEAFQAALEKGSNDLLFTLIRNLPTDVLILLFE